MNSKTCFVWSLLLLVTISCENQPNMSISLGSQSHPIVNGEEETGFPEVGALVTDSTNCTATLIRPNWILTAAHCLKNGIADLEFSMGSVALSGMKFGLAEYFVHPHYYNNPVGSLYDIALVRLSEAIEPDIAVPVPYMVDSLEPYLGETALYIGYGYETKIEIRTLRSEQWGLGIKRRVELPIDRIDLVTYSIAAGDKGLCNGDSGGPALIEIDGQPHTVGVTSAAFFCQGTFCNPPCLRGSKQTRVDRFSDWIASIIGDSFVHCSNDLERCVCPQACGDDGICDNTVCSTNTCGDILDCMFPACLNNPDLSCGTGCVDDGSIEAREQFRDFVDCWASWCRSKPLDDSLLECLRRNCDDEWDACQDQVNPETLAAHAGEDQTVQEGSEVALDGSPSSGPRRRPAELHVDADSRSSSGTQ